MSAAGVVIASGPVKNIQKKKKKKKKRNSFKKKGKKIAFASSRNREHRKEKCVY